MTVGSSLSPSFPERGPGPNKRAKGSAGQRHGPRSWARAAKARAKDLEIRQEITGRLPDFIPSDPGRLRQILLNLLGNAIKFTDRGGAIRITYRDLGSQLAIDIEDTGMGMSPEKVDNLFISRGKTKMGTDREIGTGLGLFLCKEYAEMNGGTIDVNSKLNQGTTFSLILNKA